MESKLKHYTLDNGLNVYFYKDDKKHSTFVNLVVKYGGLHSDFKIKEDYYHIEDGMSHFLEHILLEKSQYGNLMTLFGQKQMRCNGDTSANRTRYYFDTVEHLDFGIEKLIKGINEPVFTSEDVEEAKGPIYQEIRMSRDNKYRVAREITMRNILNTIPFTTVLGSLKNIEDITYEKAKICYDTFYQPKNEFIVVVGNFDENHILELIKKCFNDIKRKYNNFELVKFNEKNEVLKDFEEYKMPIGKNLAYITYKIPVSNLNGYDRLQLEMILNYFLFLNFGTISPLYKTMIDEKIICDKINFYTSVYLDFGFVTVFSLTDNFDLFVSKVKKVFNGNFNNDKEMFDLLKKDKKIRLIGRFDDIIKLTEPFIENIVTFNYDKFVETKDIDNIAFKKYLDIIKSTKFDNYTIVKIEDKK
jgi:predicted Zn-dependent peptidase